MEVVGPVLLVDPHDDIFLPEKRCASPTRHDAAALLVPEDHDHTRVDKDHTKFMG